MFNKESSLYYIKAKYPGKSENFYNEKVAEEEIAFKANEYKQKRREEYPSIEELVVALYDESDKASIIERRNAVKAKYPKFE